uniref:Uncharacterized protein n=1 Tax=Romanomermis culicivorax TaxID=13658 RepID=A0A915I8N5_ROMCU
MTFSKAARSLISSSSGVECRRLLFKSERLLEPSHSQHFCAEQVPCKLVSLMLVSCVKSENPNGLSSLILCECLFSSVLDGENPKIFLALRAEL